MKLLFIIVRCDMPMIGLKNPIKNKNISAAKKALLLLVRALHLTPFTVFAISLPRSRHYPTHCCRVRAYWLGIIIVVHSSHQSNNIMEIYVVLEQVYPLFAAVGVAVGICGFQLVRNICINPEVRSVFWFFTFYA